MTIPTAGESITERRVFPRYAIRFGVSYAVGEETVTGEGFDLSEGGIGFGGGKTCQVGDGIELDFWFDAPVNKLFKTRAVIRHVGQERMGAEFVGLDLADRVEILKAIYQYLSLHQN